jgi:DNA helicase MCM9
MVVRRWKQLKLDQRCDVDIIIFCNHVVINNSQKFSSIISEEQELEFINFWEKHEKNPLKARNLILKSMCPQLYGLYLVKLAVAMTLIGGVSTVTNSTRIRGESHMLIVIY